MQVNGTPPNTNGGRSRGELVMIAVGEADGTSSGYTFILTGGHAAVVKSLEKEGRCRKKQPAVL
jgi:hypothetical protein